MGIDASITAFPKFDQLEVVKQGTGTVTVTLTGSGSVGVATVNHNLGYIPILLAYVYTTGTFWNPMPFGLTTTTNATVHSFQEYIYPVNVTATSFQIWLAAAGSMGSSGTITRNFTYFLLRSKANANKT